MPYNAGIRAQAFVVGQRIKTRSGIETNWAYVSEAGYLYYEKARVRLVLVRCVAGVSKACDGLATHRMTLNGIRQARSTQCLACSNKHSLYDSATGCKECSACRAKKPLEEFARSSHGSGGRQTYCKQCRKDRHKSDPVPAMLYRRRLDAEECNVPFSITMEDIRAVWPTNNVCQGFCGGKVMTVGDKWDAPSLDRIRPDLGYVPGNIAIMCNRCNTRKNDHDIHSATKLYEWFIARLDRGAYAA